MIPLIHYKAGYKYQTTRDYCIRTDISPASNISTSFLALNLDGTLIISSGYAWDGATFAPDVNSIMRASLVHDALYQLIRGDFIRKSEKDAADILLRDLCVEDGMHKWMAWLVYHAVKRFGGSAITHTGKDEILVAP